MARKAPRAAKATKSRSSGRSDSGRTEAPITPLKLPRHVRTLVVFGGSFDPPHLMHVLAPLITTRTMFGDRGWLLFVPASRSPHKSGTTAPDDHRLAMLRLAIDVPGQRSIWTDELDRAAWARERAMRPSPSYTIDTLRRLRSVLPDRVEIRMLLGSDQVASFHKWRNPRQIIRLAEPLVAMRAPVESVLKLWNTLGSARFWSHEERLAWLTRLAPSAEAPMSSTAIRAAIPGAPAPWRAWSRHEPLDSVHDGVARHIIRHNLYGHRPGGVRPIDPDDVPPAPVGDDPTFARLVMSLKEIPLKDAEWRQLFARMRRAAPPERSQSGRPTRNKPKRNEP